MVKYCSFCSFTWHEALYSVVKWQCVLYWSCPWKGRDGSKRCLLFSYHEYTESCCLLVSLTCLLRYKVTQNASTVYDKDEKQIIGVSRTVGNNASSAKEVGIDGWFSDNFNFCCIICLYFGISNVKIDPVYTSSSKYIFPYLNTNNAQFGLFTSFWRLFCANLSIKCHHRHTLEYAYKK